ncbi:YncE family protein [Solibacillus sp. CAU 1738]|uniref:YncE family protein n=1 Tax=Solibacillus sp. CAU 1738 TaxID=3140363 RepID=UPI003261C7E8
MIRIMTILIVCVCLLTGCKDERFTSINEHQAFVASMNILAPSLTFYDKKGDLLATWSFDKAYTGATLIQHDRILLYGNQLKEADLYEISSGKKLATFETGSGTTNAYYASEEQMFFLTNSRTNSVISFDIHGNFVNELSLRNYPMSMVAQNGLLYVVNYKDTILSVISIADLELQAEWPIAKLSHGLVIVNDTLWLGGHGEGSNPNQTVDVLDLSTGQKIKEIETPLMPIGFAQSKDEIAVVSHGENELYVMDEHGHIKWHSEIGANPFAVTYFNNQIIVAGYDDQTLYVLEDGKIVQEIATEKGPFQLLVREDS